MTLIQRFLNLFQDSGFLLMLAAALALAVANSPFYPDYQALLAYTPPIFVFGKSLNLQLWVNDLLMAGFFLLVGLEIKRELLTGELNSKSKAALPVIAAIGGMVVPALVYFIVNLNYPEYWSGWAISSATDIAFSLAILALLGSRVPISLKIFLTALAIIDDIGAIAIIALFYSHGLNMAALILAAACCGILFLLNRMQVRNLAIYLLVGAALWVATLLSGIHATLAGVILAAFIPLDSVLERLEHKLQPIVAYLILPVFGFFNSGLNLGNLSWTSLWDPLPLSIILGLFLGKQIGIFGACYLYTGGKQDRLPPGCVWQHIYGLSILGGIGFTMSLFIGNLAFQSSLYMDSIKLGVLSGSILSAILGYWVLYGAYRKTS